ncbi:MAG: nucleotide exchange factor GrpE [Candidatus Moranbacteria bacterium CG_4_9_14_3_um_filter_40_7]|nr:MAG: nucleotide exchange factor GrpE [Candidatus Moranbacteria bacterium CG_4_9_14_3_um_filter_40_7]
MGKINFKLENEKEHEFIREEERIAFGKEEELKEMTDISIEELEISELTGIKFKELSPEQYLKVYEFMLRDNYRQEKLMKDDKGKIDLIKKYLEKNQLKRTKEEEYLEGWKRCQADFENYKKRQETLQWELAKYSGLNLIMQILPVLDNFYASTDHIPADQKENPWVIGIMYIQKQLEKILEDNGVKEIEAKTGDDFDPRIHEAVHNSQQEKEKEGRHKIAKVTLKGYWMEERIIRAARVIVE